MRQRILEAIEQNNWEEALQSFVSCTRESELDVELCILGATILEHFGDMEGMYDLLLKGLTIAPDNYELYLLLGNYYRQEKPDLAYLCYENSLYFCEKQKGKDCEDYVVISGVFDDLLQEAKISVRKTSFVILSYNQLVYTRQCIESIRENCFEGVYELVVVDNASTDGSAEWLRQQPDIKLVENSSNMGFPVGCNQGIEAAEKENDILLLNNDTVMMPNSLFTLRMGLYEDGSIGSAGAVTNYASNGQKVIDAADPNECLEYAFRRNLPQKSSYEIKSKLIMFAMLIRRDVVDKVGLLDERFSPGNLEDDDYGLRIIEAGFRNVLCHNCFIFHYGSISFEKEGREKYPELVKTNRAKFEEKWGFSSAYFTHVRAELIRLINEPADKSFSVLEIGCGMGETLARIKYKFPNAEIHGIELEPKVVAIANKKMDIIQGNIETDGIEGEYDYIIFADVLEHLRDPWAALAKAGDYLKENGHILASIPNLMNARVIYELLHGNFTYQDAGILDRTHLRFFTKAEAIRLFETTGFKVEQVLQTIARADSTEAFDSFFDKLLKLDGVQDRELFDVYQFLISACR